jgi:hypothetical protein
MNRLFALFLGIGSCVLAASNTGFGQSLSITDPNGEPDDIYKHYSGTLGKKQITLDLRYGYKGASNYGGSTCYYMDGQRSAHFYIIQPQSSEHGMPLTAHEWADDSDLYSNHEPRTPQPAWKFTISGNKLVGSWYSADQKERQDIDLTEDYTNSYPLDLVLEKDSLAFKIEGSDKKWLYTSLIYVKPGTIVNLPEGQFIYNNAIKLIGLSPKVAEGSEKLAADYLQMFASKTEAKTKRADLANSNAIAYQNNKTVLPVFNDKGLLVLECSEFEMATRSTTTTARYLCLDVANHKELQPAEILDIEQLKKSGMLDAAFRKKFNPGKDQKQTEISIPDKLPVTDNFYPVHKGVVFVFQTADFVKAQSDPQPNKQVSVYISYEKLGSIVREEFKKRLNQ